MTRTAIVILNPSSLLVHLLAVTWDSPCSAHRLTAFVARSFGQASSHIYIDQEHVRSALRWLQEHQLPTGCFQSVGKLFNNDLKVWLPDTEWEQEGLRVRHRLASSGFSTVNSSTKPCPHGLAQLRHLPRAG